MDLGIRGRRALINGASAGMGRAAAEMLAMEGVDLVICARGRERLEATAQELRQHGVSVTAVAADHSSEEGQSRILAACPDPDIFVGTCSPPPMTPDHRAITAEQWQASLETGLLSPVRFIEAVLPGMVQRRWGRIVNIASIGAKYPLELRILSGAPRAALANYVQDWSVRVGVRADLHTTGLSVDRLTSEVETTLYRIAQEALNNIAKHARAENVDVILERRPDQVSLIIEDDGIGFEQANTGTPHQGFGLLGMQERAALVGATVQIESAAGEGTTIIVRMPIVVGQDVATS